MLGMKNHFDISGSIEIREVDIMGVACMLFLMKKSQPKSNLQSIIHDPLQ